MSFINLLKLWKWIVASDWWTI